MVKDVSAYIKSTVSGVQEIRNSNKVTNGPQGTVEFKKNGKVCASCGEGARQTKVKRNLVISTNLKL